MSIVLDTVQPITKAGRAERVYLVFVRLVSLLCLISSVGYWSGLSGASDFYGVAALGTATVPVSALNVAMAALFPVAMLGLWLRARWGVAIWVGLLLVQIIVHLMAPATFGERLSMVIADVALLFAFALIAGYLVYSRYVAAESMSR
ncbi:MAG: DUF6163 family protein [Pseudomonadota bacterium]